MKPKSLQQFRAARLLFVFTIACTWSACGRPDPIDEIMKSEIAKQRIPGAAVAVLRGGKMVKAAAYGLADVEAGQPARVDTIFGIQSLTKQFTAAAVLILVDEGKLHLDDFITQHLKGCPPTWQKITVRHLLGQTSGLRDFINEPTLDLQSDVTDEQLMTSLATQPLKFEPGSAWDYSNSNYLLLGIVIGEASGRWYGDFLAERIFQPLGMSHTSVLRTRETIPGRAQGYTRENNVVRRSRAVVAIPVISYAGGGVQSTVTDLAKWDAALYTEQILKRGALAQLWTPVRLNNGSTHGYGFGWDIGEIAQHRRLSHSGKWLGFAAQIDRFVDDQLTVIVLTNLAESAPPRITRAIAGTIIPALAAPVYKPITDQEPAVTVRFLDVVRRTREGRLQADEFTAPIWEYLAPRIDQLKHDFGSFGAIQSLTLVERTESGGDRSYRYQARFSRTTMIFWFVLTKEDRISVMMPEAVNQ